MKPTPEGTQIAADAVLMHKDPEFDALAGLVSMEALPYKPSIDSP